MTSSIATVPVNPEGATKILVLGATGATGRLDVTGAKLIVGDARDETALREPSKAVRPWSVRWVHR
jgi:hypothetical protein